MITIDALRLSIGERVLLDDVNARIAPGAITCILGPNGVGKTTLLRALAGLRTPQAGEITIDGVAIRALSPRDRAQRLAFVAAEEALLDALTVADVVSIGRYSHHRWWQWRSTQADRDAVTQALGAVRMSDFAQREFATLSSGERQRIWIAMSLAQEAPVLLLDEPTSHLDVRVAHAILGLLHDLARDGKTIVCVLHDLNEAAAYADQLLLLGCGSLLAHGTPRDVLRSAAVQQAYGIEMEAVETKSGLRVFPAQAASVSAERS